MIILRKATNADLDFLVRANLLSDGLTAPATQMTLEERRAHREKIAEFARNDERRAAWVLEEDAEGGGLIGAILCRWRNWPLPPEEARLGHGIFDQLAADLFPANGRFCEVFGLWIEPAFRRRGLATRLKQHLETESRQRGIEMIYTHTEEKNLHVIELNRRLGYQEVRRGPIWDEIVRVSLIKRLPPLLEK